MSGVGEVMQNKSIVVTGAAGGMGLCVCRKFASAGFHVFGLDINKGCEIENVTFLSTDLTDMSSVESAFDEICKRTNRIECIINMAGMYDLNSLVEMTEPEFVRIFDVNLFANYRVIRTFSPILAEHGRVIIPTSELAPLDPLPFTGIYAITKAALEKYAYSLRMELELLGHKVIVIRPGAVDTGLLNVSQKRIDDFTANTKLHKIGAVRFRKIVNSVESRTVQPEKIADCVFKAASASNPKYVYNINRNPLLLVLNALPDRFQTRIIRGILKKER